MPKGPVKTNAMRMLERAGIPYEPLYYEISEEEFSGQAVAALLGLDPGGCYKTLVAKGERRGFLVFVIPVEEELNLKAAAIAAEDKRVELIPTKDVLGVTGYIRGGVSPVGMKKQYPTFFDLSAKGRSRIEVSGGAKGVSLVVEPERIIAFLGARLAGLTRGREGVGDPVIS